MESDISCARAHLRFFLDYALSCLAARQVSSSCFTRIEGNICSVFHDFFGGFTHSEFAILTSYCSMICLKKNTRMKSLKLRTIDRK